jgi:outer membrane protein OmpA-like peptidoglycan-associated protein
MASQRRERRQEDDGGDGTPGWIVSWTDMVTLLLSFFVLLQSIAVEKSDRLFELGRGSFLRALSGFGIPDWIYGQEPPMPSKQFKRVKHPMEQRERQPRDRVIDAEAEHIRQVFANLRDEVETETSDESERPVRTDALAVTFPDGGAELQAGQRESLADYADTLRENLTAPGTRIHVIGLAPDGGSPAERSVLSARRARSAEAVLQRELSDELSSGRLQLHSWGAANDGMWCRRAGVSPGGAQLVIMVTESE